MEANVVELQNHGQSHVSSGANCRAEGVGRAIASSCQASGQTEAEMLADQCSVVTRDRRRVFVSLPHLLVKFQVVAGLSSERLRRRETPDMPAHCNGSRYSSQFTETRCIRVPVACWVWLTQTRFPRNPSRATARRPHCVDSYYTHMCIPTSPDLTLVYPALAIRASCRQSISVH